MKDRQYVPAQFGIGLEDVPVDQPLSRPDCVLQLPPIVPLGVMQQQQMPDILGRMADEMLFRRRGVAVHLSFLLQ